MRKTRKTRKWTMRKKVTIISLAVVLALVAGMGSFAAYLYVKADRAITRIAGPDVPPSSTPSSSVTPPPGGQGQTEEPPEEEVEEDPLRSRLFLIAGVDTRQGGGSLNTDMLLLVAFNLKNRSASLLSLPRDMRVVADDGKARKANYFYAHYYTLDKDTAKAQTKRFFSEQLSLPIDHMVVVNFNTLRKTVDALGGLEINVEMDMLYSDSEDGTNIDLKKGLQKLSGQQTLDYVRYRKSNQGTAESSDFARNERQHVVIRKIADKLATFNGMTQWGKVLDIIGDNISTDIPEDDLRDWISDFRQLRPTEMRTIPMESEWRSPFVYVNKEDWQQAIDALRAELAEQ